MLAQMNSFLSDTPFFLSLCGISRVVAPLRRRAVASRWTCDSSTLKIDTATPSSRNCCRRNEFKSASAASSVLQVYALTPAMTPEHDVAKITRLTTTAGFLKYQTQTNQLQERPVSELHAVRSLFFICRADSGETCRKACSPSLPDIPSGMSERHVGISSNLFFSGCNAERKVAR